MDREEAMSDEELDELEALLSEIEACLSEGDVEGARAALEAAEEMAGSDDPDVGYGRALILRGDGRRQPGRSGAQAVLEADPEFADAHHRWAWLSRSSATSRAWSTTSCARGRSTTSSIENGPVGTADDLALIERVARETIEALPEEFAERLANVPVILEGRPARSLVVRRLRPTCARSVRGTRARPTTTSPRRRRVVLFTSNLLASFTGDELEEQVEITVLHEVGHYFGLDEDDMVRLGLD